MKDIKMVQIGEDVLVGYDEGLFDEIKKRYEGKLKRQHDSFSDLLKEVSEMCRVNNMEFATAIVTEIASKLYPEQFTIQ